MTRDTLIKLCNAEELAPGDMRAVEVDDLGSLAVFNLNGEFYVTSNLCTHNVAFLTEGYFEDDVIECPYHGGCFNVKTGEALEFPCVKPLPTFKVVLEDGGVFIENGAV